MIASRKVLAAIFLSAALLVIICGGLGFILRRGLVRYATPEKITWDFRHGRTFEAVHWPTSDTGTVFERTGNFDLTIIYKDGEEFFHERVHNFICERKPDKVGNIYLLFDDGCNVDEAYQTLKKLMRNWNLDAKNFSDLDRGGDYIGPGYYTASQLGFTNDMRTVTFFLEGVNSGNYTITVAAYPTGNLNDIPVSVTNSVAVIDPSPEHWGDWQNKSLAAAGIVLSNWHPDAGFARQRTNVEHVYQYYERLYNWSVDNSSERFLWAGQAKLAGGPVYGALEDLLHAEIELRDVGTLTCNYLADVTHAIAENLLQGQQNIFLDLAWQFEAYKQQGLDALDEVFFRDHQPTFRKTAYKAWQAIDSGVWSNIVLGNRDLLNIEQQFIIQPSYAAIQRLAPIVSSIQSIWIPATSRFIPLTIGAVMGSMVQNPVPNALSFWAFPPTAGKDLANYADRWNWLENCMIPAFTGPGVTTAMRSSWIHTGLIRRAAETRMGDAAIDAFVLHLRMANLP